MSEQTFTLGSPEILKFLNLTEKDVAPEYASERVGKLSERLGTADSLNYQNQLIKQGASPQAFDFLNDYIKFERDWKNPDSIRGINSLTNIAQNQPDRLYSYALKEGPLYRGQKLAVPPSVGDTIEFSRFKSFSPDINIAGPFVNEGPPIDFSLKGEAFKKQVEESNRGRKVLFQVQANSPGNYNYLITPGGEPEVLSRPGAKYSVKAKETFPFWQRGMTGDIDFIKLQQIYGINPEAMALQGGLNLVKENARGAAMGAGFAALDPTVAKQIENNKYKEAAGTIARDVVFGGLAEEGLKLAGKYAPSLTGTIAPTLRIASPVFTGTALVGQGREGSLTDVITKKAAENQISFLPSNAPNPETDLGARASRVITNEGKYILNSLLKKQFPYMR